MSPTVDPVPAPSADGPDLVALVGRVSRADRNAFAHLHELLSPAVVAYLRTTPLERIDTDAIAVGTFIEVWWLARHHASLDTDVSGWVLGVAARRGHDRLRDAVPDPPRLTDEPGPAALAVVELRLILALHDERDALALTRLLDRRRGPARGPLLGPPNSLRIKPGGCSR